MKTFQTIIGIDVAQDSLAISIFNGKEHQLKEFNYSKRGIRKPRIVMEYELDGIYLAKEKFDESEKVKSIDKIFEDLERLIWSF